MTGGSSGEIVTNIVRSTAEEVPTVEPSRGVLQGKRPAEGNKSLVKHFRHLDKANQQNIARASLGIRTSAELFQATQSAYKEARADRSSRRAETRRTRGGSSGEVVANAARSTTEEVPIAEPSRGVLQEKRPAKGTKSLAKHFRRLDEANQQNVARSGLGIRMCWNI